MDRIYPVPGGLELPALGVEFHHEVEQEDDQHGLYIGISTYVLPHFTQLFLKPASFSSLWMCLKVYSSLQL